MQLFRRSKVKVKEQPLTAAPPSPAWWKDAVVYHIYLPSFMDSDHDGVGDIGGVVQRLPYLAGLGVDTLWLWPAAPAIEQTDAGKTGVLSPDDLPKAERTAFAALLRGAQERGMRVLLGPDSTSIPQEYLRVCAAQRAELDMLPDAGHLPLRGRTARAKAACAEDGQLELAELKRYYLNRMARYGAEYWMPLFLESSSLPRIVSRFGAGGLHRAILAKMLAVLLFTLRGTPILYQGQELGLPGTRFASVDEMCDPAAAAQYAGLCEKMDAAAAFHRVLAGTAAHARAPVPWAAGPGGGFTGAAPWMRLPDGADFLHVAAQMEDKNSVWRFYQRLMALRKASPCLVHGNFNPVFAKNRRVFCYFRIWEGRKWYVEINLTEHQVPRPGRILPSQKLELSNYDLPVKALRAYEANIYRCE